MTRPPNGKVPALGERRDSSPHQGDQLDQSLELRAEVSRQADVIAAIRTLIDAAQGYAGIDDLAAAILDGDTDIDPNQLDDNTELVLIDLAERQVV